MLEFLYIGRMDRRSILLDMYKLVHDYPLGKLHIRRKFQHKDWHIYTSHKLIYPNIRHCFRIHDGNHDQYRRDFHHIQPSNSRRLHCYVRDILHLDHMVMVYKVCYQVL